MVQNYKFVYRPYTMQFVNNVTKLGGKYKTIIIIGRNSPIGNGAFVGRVLVVASK